MNANDSASGAADHDDDGAYEVDVDRVGDGSGGGQTSDATHARSRDNGKEVVMARSRHRGNAETD